MTKRVKTNVMQVLAMLAKKEGIGSAELARRAGLKQPIVQRLMHGTANNPTISTLVPLAKQFSVTVSQLLGEDPIIPGQKLIKPPEISWEQVLDWPNVDELNYKNFFVPSKIVSKDSYVLTVSDTEMFPLFPEDAKLFVDPALMPQNKDFVIAYLKSSAKIVFRQLFFDDDHIVLKPLNSDFKTLHIEKTDCDFKGVVVESRIILKP